MMSVRSTRTPDAPNWFESFLFLALMSGPPKFRGRDLSASLTGVIDLVVVIHIVIWACGGLWVLARLYPAAVRRGVVPSANPAQAIGALFIAALTLSLRDSPGILLSGFTLGQFAVMLGFAWVFTHRFGTSACLRHLFIGVTVLALATVAATFLAPGLVGTDETNVSVQGARIGGDFIAGTANVAVTGIVLCLSSVPPLRGPMFWGALSLFSALLVASRTRTAYVALVAFLTIGFVCGKRLPVRRLLLPLAAVILGVVFMDAFASTTDYVLRERESIQTMSDRIPLWQHLTSVVMRESPLTGLGYYAASRLLATEYNASLGTAHSVFFEVLVGGGIVGAALYVLLCASLIWFAVKLLRKTSGQPEALASAGLLSVALVMGITSETALHAGPLGFAFWSTTALIPRLSRGAARERMAREQQLHAGSSTLRAGPRIVSPVMNRQADRHSSIHVLVGQPERPR
jgi:O-antigen ligase